MKKLLLIGGLIALGFVACKDDDDDKDVPTPLPTFPTGQYRVMKMEFRDSTNQLVENFVLPQDSSMYIYYNAVGQFNKAVTVLPTNCYSNWTEFEDALSWATYDSTQFFPAQNFMIMHFYVGWQTMGLDDTEYMYFHIAKSTYLQADTVSCN